MVGAAWTTPSVLLIVGANPSLADDILFLRVGPLVVQQKLRRWVTTGSVRGGIR